MLNQSIQSLARLSLKYWLTAMLIGVLANLNQFASAANPTHETPKGYLDFHAVTPEGKAIGEETIKTLEALQEYAEELSKKIDGKKIGPAVAQSRKFAALVLRLKAIGEPASWDLALRGKRPSELVSVARTKYFATPESKVMSDKSFAELRKADKKLQAAVAKAMDLAKKEEWDEAEKVIDKLLVPFWEKAAYLQGSGFGGGRAIEDADNAITEHQAVARANRFAAEADIIILQNEASRKTFADVLVAIKPSIAQTGKVNYNGKSLSGPEVVNQLLLDFGPIHVQMLQSGFLECLKTSAESARQSSGSSSSAEHPGLVAWGQKNADLCGLLQKEIAAIIEADTAQLNSQAATQAYIAYCQALGPHLSRFDTKPWLDTRNVLALLAAKSEARISFENYREASEEMLRWRNRLVENRVTKLTDAQFPHIHKTFRDAASGRDNVPGLYNNGDPIRTPPHCTLPLPDNVENTWKEIQNKSISTERIVRFEGEKPLFMSRVYAGVFARPRDAMPIDSELASLKYDLLVDDTHPPLGLEAEYALATAQKGELDHVGGNVIGMAIESLCNRFVKLPAIAGQFVRYPGSHASFYPSDNMAALAVRLDVQPKWWATRYLIKLPE